MTGVINLYGKFKEQLKEEQSKVAPLQLLGRMEDFFTKEFACLTLVESTGKVLPLTNFGRKADGRRIDMVLVQGDLSQVLDRKSEYRPTISALIELKYVRNRHRFGYNSAEDEIATTFKDLSDQLGRMRRRKYADYQVKLRSSKGEIYGLILVSYVRRQHEKDTAENFRKRVLGKAVAFEAYNFKPPRLAIIYKDCPVTVLNGEFRVSLSAGLWRLRESAPANK